MQAMKPIAILLAAVTLLGSLAATLLAWLVETFPFENTRPDDQNPAALILTGLLALVCACFTLAWIASDRVHLALAAYAVQVVAGFVLLMQAVGESAHSDGPLALFALVVELPAAAAVAISLRRRRSPSYQ
jgi:hypothetical protein